MPNLNPLSKARDRTWILIDTPRTCFCCAMTGTPSYFMILFNPCNLPARWIFEFPFCWWGNGLRDVRNLTQVHLAVFSGSSWLLLSIWFSFSCPELLPPLAPLKMQVSECLVRVKCGELGKMRVALEEKEPGRTRLSLFYFTVDTMFSSMRNHNSVKRSYFSLNLFSSFHCTCSMWEFWGQGSKQRHSSNLSYSSNGAGSLTCWATRELQMCF